MPTTKMHMRKFCGGDLRLDFQGFQHEFSWPRHPKSELQNLTTIPPFFQTGGYDLGK
jgi:hypothetical protein